MKLLGYIGIDQHNNMYNIDRHPRKELMEQLGRKSAAKMYCDTKDGKVRHTGYIVAGCWIRVYAVHEWKEAV